MIGKPKIITVGRKRKPGQRFPSGDIKPERDVDTKIIAFSMPHRQGVPAEIRHDPKAESQLGIYQLNGKITKAEYDAGRWYAGVVNRYRAVIDAPKSSPNSNAGTMIPVFGAQRQAIDDDEAERRTSTYNHAFEVVGNVGQRAARAVARVAVYGERCPEGLFNQMRLGLIALAIDRGFATEQEMLDIRRHLVHLGNRR